MRNLIIVATILLVVPATRAQRAETRESQPQTGPQVMAQEITENSKASDALPASIRPGHPLDPADVDVLTGKKDRELEESHSAAFYYGGYADFNSTNEWRGARYDFPMLPLTRIRNPFLFSTIPPRGFGRGGLRSRR
jgi:hypothetical protein